MGVVRILAIYQDRPIYSMFIATSTESSGRDLLNGVAEHMSILKNSQNTYYPRFSFTPKTGIQLPGTDVLF